MSISISVATGGRGKGGQLPPALDLTLDSRKSDEKCEHIVGRGWETSALKTESHYVAIS